MSGYNMENPNESYLNEEVIRMPKRKFSDELPFHVHKKPEDGRVRVSPSEEGANVSDWAAYKTEMPIHKYQNIKSDNGIDHVLIDAIAAKVVEEFKPWFNSMREYEACGVLKGSPAIAKYMGLYVPRQGEIDPSTGKAKKINACITIRRWFLKYGFPMAKDLRGKWYTTKSLLDKWIFENSNIMRKSIELGYLAPRNYPNRLYFAAELLTEEQREACIREIAKDRIRMGMSG